MYVRYTGSAATSSTMAPAYAAIGFADHFARFASDASIGAMRRTSALSALRSTARFAAYATAWKPGPSRPPAIARLDLRVPRRIDEHVLERRHELVARRAVHRPVRGQRLVRREDLLDDDRESRPAHRRLARVHRCAQPLEIAPRLEQPVDVVDAQAVHQAVRHELQHRPVRRVEHLGVLDRARSAR